METLEERVQEREFVPVAQAGQDPFYIAYVFYTETDFVQYDLKKLGDGSFRWLDMDGYPLYTLPECYESEEEGLKEIKKKFPFLHIIRFRNIFDIPKAPW